VSGCDTLDDAVLDAREAIDLCRDDKNTGPIWRRPEQLRSNPQVAEDLRTYHLLVAVRPVELRDLSKAT
jgi:hypothetical protein